MSKQTPADDPMIGTWKVNLAKSTYTPGPPPKSATNKFEPWEDGVRATIDLVDAEGNKIHAEVAAKFDGKDYPIKGSPIADAVLLKRINERQIDVVWKKAGKVTVTGKSVISSDGRTTTVSQTGNDPQGRAVNNVTGLWGMQVADLKTAEIVTATVSEHPDGSPGLMHGIGWTPDQSEVWQSSTWNDPHVFVWNMANPMAPVLKQALAMRSAGGAHWLTFTIAGDFAYVAPNKHSEDGTEIFDARSHASVGAIGSSEDLLEIDFADGKITQVGDQYGIGRR